MSKFDARRSENRRENSEKARGGHGDKRKREERKVKMKVITLTSIMNDKEAEINSFVFSLKCDHFL